MTIDNNVHDCTCREEDRYLNLDRITLLFFCSLCGGFATGLDGQLDVLIDALTNMRDNAFRGQVVQWPDDTGDTPQRWVRRMP